jgi:hypothetical protein
VLIYHHAGYFVLSVLEWERASTNENGWWARPVRAEPSSLHVLQQGVLAPVCTRYFFALGTMDKDTGGENIDEFRENFL